MPNPLSHTSQGYYYLLSFIPETFYTYESIYLYHFSSLNTLFTLLCHFLFSFCYILEIVLYLNIYLYIFLNGRCCVHTRCIGCFYEVYSEVWLLLGFFLILHIPSRKQVSHLPFFQFSELPGLCWYTFVSFIWSRKHPSLMYTSMSTLFFFRFQSP